VVAVSSITQEKRERPIGVNLVGTMPMGWRVDYENLYY